MLEICDVDNGYEAGEQIILYLEHNCSQHGPDCTWDNRSNTVEISTQSRNSSHKTVESTLNISKGYAEEGVHSLSRSLAYDKTVSALITVTRCKSVTSVQHDQVYSTLQRLLPVLQLFPPHFLLQRVYKYKLLQRTLRL